jgi:hypothetical protein
MTREHDATREADQVVGDLLSAPDAIVRCDDVCTALARDVDRRIDAVVDDGSQDMSAREAASQYQRYVESGIEALRAIANVLLRRADVLSDSPAPRGNDAIGRIVAAVERAAQSLAAQSEQVADGMCDAFDNDAFVSAATVIDRATSDANAAVRTAVHTILQLVPATSAENLQRLATFESALQSYYEGLIRGGFSDDRSLAGDRLATA